MIRPAEKAAKPIPHVHAAPKASRRMLCVLILLVGASTITVRWPALAARAVSFDDYQYLIDNPLVRNPSWSGAGRFLVEVLAPSTVHGYYQPLTMISLMLDVRLGGGPDNFRPFHRTSLLLHAANTGLIVLLLYQLFGNVWAAAAVGLVFGVHPLTVEPIPWIGERKTLLAAFFALASLVSYVRFARGGGRFFYSLSLGGCILAMMSKPTSTPLPLVMLLLDFWPLRRLRAATVIEKAPFFAVAIAFAVITIISQARTAGATMPTSYPSSRIPLILCHNIVFYATKMVWPASLSAHYPFPDPLTLAHPAVLRGVIGTGALLLVLALSLRWTRALATGWMMFFVAILPTMQIIGFSNVIASDKYAYLPAIGILIALAWLLVKLTPDGKPSRRWILVLTVLLVASAESVASRRVLATWVDTETHYNHMLSLAPDSPSLHDDMGNELTRQGRLDEAIYHYSEALRLKPTFSQAHYSLGTVLVRHGRLDEAVAHYSEALRLKPTFPQAHVNLGNVLARQGRLDDATSHFTEALRISPQLPKAQNSLGIVLARQGRLDEAIAQYEEALQVKPDYSEAHYNLGNALTRLGRYDEAIRHYKDALRLKPGWAEAHHNLGFELVRMARYDEAIYHLQEALRYDPSSAETHANLGLALARLGRTGEAIDHLLEAIKIAPGRLQPQLFLGDLLAGQGRLEEAIEHYQQALRIDPNFAEAKDRLKAVLPNRVPDRAP